MKRLFFVFSALCFATILSAATVNYTADNSTIFPNPERGFITMLEGKQTSKYPYHAVKSSISTMETKVAADKLSLILVEYYLDEFRDKGILPDSVLNAFDTDMQILRKHGLKAILRFAYTNSDAGEIGHDAPLNIVEQHLAQLKSHWEANADVIFCFQAGFIGSWGEWYYSEYFGNKSSHMNRERKQFLDTLLKTVPQDRCIQIRTPLFKTEYLDSLGVSQSALTADEAYKGTPKARLAHHNDAFLYNASNQGTYSDTATQKPYIAQETLYVPIGGECNISDSLYGVVAASHDTTIKEMSRLHWTFIQSGFSTKITNRWRQETTFDELNRNLGYRYQFVSSTIPDAATAGTNININLQIQNVGFAPLYNERHVYLVLKNAKATYTIQLATDPRTWLPNGVKTTIEETIALPAGIPTGKYQLYLYMPDIYPSLADDPRYAIRFANTDIWNETIGMNRLKANIDISSEVPAVALDTVSLPGTLNKSNVADYYEDTWIGTNKDYYDFGSSEGANTDRWVEWKVDIEQAGKYVLTEVFDVPTTSNGHQWRIDLLDASSNKVDSFNTTRVWRNGEERVEPTKWTIRKPGKYTLRVTNAFSYSKPKLKSLKFDYFGPVSTDTIVLPDTLTKANVADYSDEIGWYNTDYIDFGVRDAANTNHWADWNVNLKYPGQYTITEIGYYPNGHNYSLALVKLNGDTINSYTTAKTYSEGDLTITQTSNWDLSDIPAGKYFLRVSNAMKNGRPKLQSLILKYDGELPTGIDNTTDTTPDGQMYDILGRPVDDSYHGIIIMRGKKILRP